MKNSFIVKNSDESFNVYEKAMKKRAHDLKKTHGGDGVANESTNKSSLV